VLLEDVDAQLEFAAEAFGAAPDAVNLWIGDQRSETTFHKDHYENL
jgi:jumonji domain-containing protein 7